MNPHLPENIIGMALVLAIFAVGVIEIARGLVKVIRLALQGLRIMRFKRRHELEPWQPKPSWKRPAVRRPR